MGNAMGNAALVATLCALALAACDREDMQRADRAGAKVGRKADAVIAKSKDVLTDAGHRAGAALSDANKRIESATAPHEDPPKKTP